jgi:hypothetical protein
MGKIIEAKFDMILPEENRLNKGKLKTIVKYLGVEKSLLPIPVRERDGKYVNLDGRNRLIYHYLSGDEKVELFLSEYAVDFMHRFDFPEIDPSELKENNRNISRRWQSAMEVSEDIGVKNYHEHFNNLRKEFYFLKNLDTCKEYLGILEKIYLSC